MVFFTCNACGESVKRGQVQKHYLQQCRSCDILSCVDCGKDFRGDTYLEHTKCISEEEKYSGKDYKPKPGANKGEKKQDAWLENVQKAIEKANTNPKVKSLLLQIKDYPNIPRKKQKFENFLKNSLRMRDTSLISQAWDRINSEIAKDMEAKENEEKIQAANENASKSKEAEKVSSEEAPEEDASEKKLSKREKKEERRKQNNKKEKKDRSEEDGGEKKSKKRKLEEIHENGDSEIGSKKKKKKKKGKEEDVEEEPAEEEEEQEEQMEERPKFKWDSVILQVLQSAKGNEISMKKLKKKVLSEFMATGGDGQCATEERMISKFYKKVMKKTYWKIIKDNVKLNEPE